MLDYNIFKMQMNTIAVILKQKQDESVLKSEYYPIFKNFDSKRFAEVIEHFKKHYEYSRFPLPSDFNKSIQATNKNVSTYKPIKSNRVAYSFKWVIDGLKAMEMIERQLIGKHYDQTPKAKRMEKYRPFIREKMRNDEIYNTVAKRWGKSTAHRSHPPETYFNPRDFYPEKEWA